MRIALAIFLTGLFTGAGFPALADGGIGLPDLTTQMRQQSDDAVQRFRGAAGAGRKQRQRLRAQRRAREKAFREKREKRRKQMEESGLLVPKP